VTLPPTCAHCPRHRAVHRGRPGASEAPRQPPRGSPNTAARSPGCRRRPGRGQAIAGGHLPGRRCGNDKTSVRRGLTSMNRRPAGSLRNPQQQRIPVQLCSSDHSSQTKPTQTESTEYSSSSSSSQQKPAAACHAAEAGVAHQWAWAWLAVAACCFC
jgi:hypothetical protein